MIEQEKQQEQEFIQQINVKWIRAESGNTYLCPVDALKRLKDPREEELRLICVDESENPENN